MSAPRNIVSRRAARVQQPVGEDVPALGVGAELDLVDGEEVDRAVERHRLDGADPVARSGGTIFSSPVISATARLADARDDAVVVLARQQAQREADHARSRAPSIRSIGAMGRDVGPVVP